jgi:hypothetical protein
MEFWLDANYSDLRLGRSPVVVNVDAVVLAPVDADRSDLRYVLEVWVQNGYRANDFVRVAELLSREEPILAGATLSQGAFFRIEERLLAELKPKNPQVSGGYSRFQVVDGATRQYYTVAKRYNGETLLDSTTNPTAWVVDAGLNTVDFRDWGNRFFTDYVGAGRKFLTWQADRKLIGRKQREWLYFITNFTPLPETLKLWRRKIVMNQPDADDPNGFVLIDEVVDFTEGISAMTVYGVDVRVDDLPDNISTVMYWLTNENDEIVSERRTFVISDDAVRNEQNLIFQNSLGGFDTLRLVGDVTDSMRIGRTVSEKWPGWDFAAEFTEREISDVRGIRELTVTTGYLSKVQQKWLTDMALSSEFWLVSEKGLIGLEPLFLGYLMRDSREQASGRMLSFRQMSEDLNFSDLPNDDVVLNYAWRANRSNCGLDGFGKRDGMKVVVDLELYDIITNNPVKPRQVEANTVNHVGYIAPFLAVDCAAGNTPFLSLEIIGSGTFNRTSCDEGKTGGAATILIAAGAYGSELSQADANAKAQAAWNTKNTQAYADEFGSCTDYAAGLLGKWYHFTSGNEANAFAGAVIATRTDEIIDYSSVEGNRPAGVNSDLFAVRWTGKVIGPVSGTVTFSIQHDDGVRLWIDNVLIIDRWQAGAVFSEATAPLTKDKLHDIKIEYFENSGGSVMKLRWRYAGQNTIAVPGGNLRS